MSKKLAIFLLCFSSVLCSGVCATTEIETDNSKSNSLIETNNSKSNNLVDSVMTTYIQGLPEDNCFFSLLSRMKYIDRWSLLSNKEEEDLEHHSYEVALIAHALCTIENIKFDGNLNAERAAVIGMFHDATEILTGDMPSTMKYCDTRMKPLYTEIENQVTNDMLECISDKEIREEYKSLLSPSSEDKETKMVKIADKISAVIKCLREKRLGNNDFDKAFESISKDLLAIDEPSVKYFIDTFLPSYGFDIYLDLGDTQA